MSFQVQINEEYSHLLVKAMGTYSLSDLSALLDVAKEEAEKRSSTRVLLDLSDVAGWIPALEIFQLGQHCGEAWNRNIALAIVAPPAGFDRLLEDVARQQGVSLAVVANQCAALVWLKV